jgi:hypothetical protein
MPHVPPLLTPSYSTDLCEAFTDVARAIISESGYLDTLAFAANARGLPGLPSWVPDWSSRANLDDDSRIIVNLRIASLGHYHTSGEAKAEAYLTGNILTVKAACLGVVQSCAKIMDSKKRLWTTLHKWLRLAACHHSRKEGYRRHDKPEHILWHAFRRTVHTDIFFHSDRGLRMGLQVLPRMVDVQTEANIQDFDGKVC